MESRLKLSQKKIPKNASYKIHSLDKLIGKSLLDYLANEFVKGEDYYSPINYKQISHEKVRKGIEKISELKYQKSYSLLMLIINSKQSFNTIEEKIDLEIKDILAFIKKYLVYLYKEIMLDDKR